MKRSADSDGGFEVDAIQCLENPIVRQKNVPPNVWEQKSMYYTNGYYGDDEDDFYALFVRRGHYFHVTVQCNKDYADETFSFELSMSSIRKPKTKNGTLVQIDRKTDETEKDEPCYEIVNVSGATVNCKVQIPANMIVSRYELRLRSGKSTVDYGKKVYVLFNPWCEDDETYFPNTDQLDEYVLADTGAVWWGGMRPKPWYFAQFEKDVVNFVFELLERQAWISRRDTAPEIARQMSGYINSCDQQYGVLEGNWSGDYSGGEKPWMWSGSKKIIETYLKTGNVAVQFGQCWVFSGLTTTVMRCLGMPARSVTNYGSAHDTEGNLTLDKYFDENGIEQEDESDDSCWNFHVWNDVWMARNDLPEGFGGWQAIDATPQEESSGIMRCGPAPLAAIKNGEVTKGFDTKFLFAEVNADRVEWTMSSETGEYEPTRISTKSVGKCMLTKMPYYQRVEDVMKDYKHDEGSVAEAAARNYALKKVRNKCAELKRNRDVKMKVRCPDEVPIGGDVQVTVTLTNKHDTEDRVVSLVLNSKLTRYNGVPLKKIRPAFEYVSVAAGKTESKVFTIESSHHIPFLDESPNVQMNVFMKVPLTGQVYSKPAECAYDKPDVTLQLDGNVVEPGQAMSVTVTTPNLPVIEKYTNVEVELEGNALKGDITQNFSEVAAGGSVTLNFTIPKKKSKQGKLQLNAKFSSEEIKGLKGHIEMDLKKGEQGSL